MTVKYRLRLESDRVVGPLAIEEVKELFFKGEITGSEECQVFPVGDWKPISSYAEIYSYLEAAVMDYKREQAQKKIEAKKIAEANPVPKLVAKKEESELRKQIPKKSDLKKEEPLSSDSVTSEMNFDEFKFSKKQQKVEIDYNELGKKLGEASDVDKTRVNQKKNAAWGKKAKNADAEKEIEKTRVVNPNWKEELAEKERKKKIKENVEEVPILNESDYEVVEQEEKQLVTIDAHTQFLNLTQILPSLNAELMQAEVEFENERLLQENRARLEEERKVHKKIEKILEKKKDKEKAIENTESKKKRKGMTPIIAFAFLAIFYVLMNPEPENKSNALVNMPVKFPVTLKFENIDEAKKLLSQGKAAYSDNTYLKRIKAAQFFSASLSNRFNNNEAIGDLILVFAENYKNVKKIDEANLVIFKLIQIAENRLYTDPNVATGAALFYKNMNKPFAGINIVKNYIRLDNKPTSKMFGYYLELLMDAGQLKEARDIFESLEKAPKKSFEVYNSMIKFAQLNDDYPKVVELLEEGQKYYPNSVLLLLKQVEILLRDSKINEFEKTLKKINLLNCEGSPYYYSKFFENMGYLSVLKKKNKEAVEFFKKSLKLYESEELRSKLSNLEVSGDAFSQELILESKIQDLLKKAREEVKKQNWEIAFTYTTEAIDANPDHVDAVLLQTEMQINRGHFDPAFFSLRRMLQKFPNNEKIKKNLILAYIYSSKYAEAQKTLGEMSQTKFALTDQYAMLMAQYYELINNPIQTSRWYVEVLRRNGLNDEAMYRLAKFYMRFRQYENAREKISKALQFDPKNVDYHILNSEIHFERDGADTAIGYLRDLMSENGEDVRYLSTIAIYYSKSGQVKEFESLYKTILALGKKDENFYKYLIKMAKLNDNVKDVITYTQELLKINPGDLHTRMEFGEFLLFRRRNSEALTEFLNIQEKLTSYPKVHYNLARVYINSGDLKMAKTMADKELELNPSLDLAYFIVGEVARLQERYQDAREKLEKAIAINSKSVEALMALGWIKLKQNYYSEAFELYTRAYKEDKNNPEIHKMLAYCYKASGQRALAKEKFEDYLKLNPGASDRSEIEGLIRFLQ